MSDFIKDVGGICFQHEAMAAVFEIVIINDDPDYAAQAARAAFKAIDTLEGDFSRYIEDSDISRVNSLRAGQSTVVGLNTFECLQLCEKINTETFGAFDITVGSLYKCWLNKDKTLKKPTKEELKLAKEQTGMHLVKLDEEEFSVTLMETGVQLDLGAIGKGYALDTAAEVLKEWSIKTALLHTGGSTVLAIGKPKDTEGWPVTMSLLDNLWKKKKTDNPKIETLRLYHLNNSSLSGSNLEVGKHVIEPRKGKPVEANIASWSIVKSAAWADALSTALLVMTDNEAEKYFKKHKDHKGMVISPNWRSYKVKQYGQWPKVQKQNLNKK